MRTRIWIIGLGVLLGLSLKITIGYLSGESNPNEAVTDQKTVLEIQAVEPAE